MLGFGFDSIAFDGDDTLWHNERSYPCRRANGSARCSTTAGVDLTEEEIEEASIALRSRNRLLRYGVSSFILSLIETAIDLTGGRVAGAELGRT